jgi:putative transposase
LHNVAATLRIAGDSQRIYFVSFATVHWIDVFTRNEYKDKLIKSWQYCQANKGLQIYAWCIMPSHVHMLISSTDKSLDKIVGEMKSYTSTQLRKLINEHPQESRKEWMLWMFERAGKKNSNNNDFQFWQQHNKPLEIVNAKMYDETVWYIHQNPVVAGFV